VVNAGRCFRSAHLFQTEEIARFRLPPSKTLVFIEIFLEALVGIELKATLTFRKLLIRRTGRSE